MAIDRLPDSQRLIGILTVAELLRAGVTESELKILAGRGTLMSVGHGTYARTALAKQMKAAKGGSTLLALAVAVAGVGPDAIVSHRAAATLHGLQMLRRARSDDIEIARPPGSRGSRTAKPGSTYTSLRSRPNTRRKSAASQ